MSRIDDEAFDVLFRDARRQNKWLDRPVSEELLRELYEIVKWGPTSGNGCPMRIVFAASPEAKEKVATTAMSGNQEKIRTAPVVAVIGYDGAFFEKLSQLFPHDSGMADFFRGNAEVAEITAFRNGTLQGAYLMIVARGLGLDCGPMSGFDNAACDEFFFAGTTVKSNFLCGIGYGDPEGLFERLPRLSFEEACKIL